MKRRICLKNYRSRISAFSKQAPRLGAEVEAIVISLLIFIEFNIVMANMTVKERS